MSETRSFAVAHLTLNDLLASLTNWLVSENFEAQVLRTDDGATVVQIAKKGGWRKLVGMSTALNVAFREGDSRLNVEIAAGRWIDKAAVGTVSIFILWPLALTAAFGAWQQMKMPDRVFDHISTYLIKPRDIVVNIDSELDVVPGPAEKVNVPQGARITIKRSRTIDRSVTLQSTTSSETTLSVTELDVFTRSVRRAVEEKSGSTLKESETIEHEVQLDGASRSEYTLVWLDSIRRGNVHFVRGSAVEVVPFAFREQTELRVT
jgi:hypothetical protein